MKVQTEFAPITIVIETEEELKSLKETCTHSYNQKNHRFGFGCRHIPLTDLEQRILTIGKDK